MEQATLGSPGPMGRWRCAAVLKALSCPMRALPRVPLGFQVMVGAALGAVVGVCSGPGGKVQDLGQLGMLVIRLMKGLAVPLIFFAILDAFMRMGLSARAGLKLIAISAMNATVALSIGLTLLNTIQPGRQWEGQLSGLIAKLSSEGTPGKLPGAGVTADLNPLKNVMAYVPDSIVEPFLKNSIISVVLFSLLLGIAFRRQRQRAQSVLDLEDLEGDGRQEAVEARETLKELRRVSQWVGGVYCWLVGSMELVVNVVPFAVFGIVAMVVAQAGLAVFQVLWTFLWVILLGMALHGLVYYPAIAWLLAGRTPKELWRGGSDAILTGMSTNSSLATVPVTLRCLKRLGVSDSSARLSACLGTNLNNDGVTLYETMAALFLAQACGFHLNLGQQLVVVVASVMAGIGVAGIPEAGLVVLPLVLGAAGLPESVVSAALPLILPVDWVIGRCRSAINVSSDMLVAILVDAWEGHSGRCPRSAQKEPVFDEQSEQAPCSPEHIRLERPA